MEGYSAVLLEKLWAHFPSWM